MVLANCGEISLAEQQAQKAAAQSPTDQILNSELLATVRALVHLHRHEPQAAIESLEETRPFDLNIVTGLGPSYYRGMAYLELNQPRAAAAEFQRVLDHRSIMPDSTYVPLAAVELGHALRLTGNAPGAEQAFGIAERVWKDADPGFPPLQKFRTGHRTGRPAS